MRKKRSNKGSNIPGSNSEGLTSFKDGVEMVPAAYVPGVHQTYLMLPERPRFLTLRPSSGQALSDGQVLDRANQPLIKVEGISSSGPRVNAMLRANDSAFGFKPSIVPLPVEFNHLRANVITNEAHQDAHRGAVNQEEVV